MPGINVQELPDLNAEYTMQVYDINGAPIEGCTITLTGQDSDAYKAELYRIQKEQLASSASGRGPSPKEMSNSVIRLHAASIKSWTGFRMGDAEWPCTPENVRKLLELAPNINEQVDRAIKDRANFLSDSSRP